VLHHANTDYPVEPFAAQFPIVLQSNTDPVIQRLLIELCVAQSLLRLAARDPGDLDGMMARGVKRQRASSAADV
jgi:hypothetical protein